MKRIFSIVLILTIVLSAGSVLALAEEAETKILVDGVKDEAYNIWKMLDHSYWNYYYQETNDAMEPWFEERVKNTLWFDWDDNYIYLYFQAQNHKDFGGDLYQPKVGETAPPTNDTFFERVMVCLDTAPSAPYNTHCSLPHNAIPEEDECDHFYCNTVSGEGASHRLMVTFVPAWNVCDAYASTEEWEGVSFIDYTTNTYGFELKYPRLINQSYFQLNIVNYVNDKDDWEVDAPELGYTQAFCGNPRINSKDLLEIYFDDYPKEPTPQDYEIAQPVADMVATIPDSLTIEDKILVEKCSRAYKQLTPTQKSLVPNWEKIKNAEESIIFLNVEWLIDQIPEELTQENKYLVIQANTAFQELPYNQKYEIKNYKVLENALIEKRLLDVIEGTENLPQIITKQDKERVTELWALYEYLPLAKQRQMTNYETLFIAYNIVRDLSQVCYGDIDANGTIGAKDALKVLKFAVGKEPFSTKQKLAAEVDRKEGINAKDALEILKYAVGKVQEFPVEIVQ